MRVAERELHGAGGQDVFNSEGNNDLSLADRTLDLTPDLRRVIGRKGEDQQNDLALIKRIDNGLSVFLAGEDIAGRNPARDILRL
jgi:hypothetical protein